MNDKTEKPYWAQPIYLTGITERGGGESYLKGEFGGCILVDKDGNETHYSPEEWRHKQIIDKLDKLIELLTAAKSSI